MTAYYSENDPFAAAWLRELMRDGLIAPGWVDERSIEDVLPVELQGFTQCHFFAGIGVWSLALRLAGWPDDRPIWTGSCPCQPFSNAGKGSGFADERHLWPAWFHLITHGKRRDCPVVGEQVASKDGRTWFDLVSSDMESLDHGCGAVDTSAASLGAPFIGQRLYWLASTHHQGSQGRFAAERSGGADQRAVDPIGVVSGLGETDSERRTRIDTLLRTEAEGRFGASEVSQVAGSSAGCRLASSDTEQHDRSGQSGSSGWPQPSDDCAADRLATSESGGYEGDALRTGRIGSSGDAADCQSDRLAPPTSGQPRHGDVQSGGQHRQQPQDASHSDDCGIPLHPVNYWRDADWLLCRDPNGARFRPVEPGTFPLVDAGAVRNRLAAVRGAGNALNVSQAACFIEAVMEHLDAQPYTGGAA